MAVGNRYELISFFTLLGQEMLNRYWYKQIAGTATNATFLATDWLDTVYTAMKPVQSADCVLNAVGVHNVDVPTDFTLVPLVAENFGDATGQNMPPFACWAFRYNRASLEVRNGAKRIPGLTEDMQDDGAAVAGTLSDNLDALAAAMAANLEGTGNPTYEPRIMRVIRDPESGIVTYDDFGITGVQYVRLSTQNTRKFGRGA